jgi:hypothetical protein
MPTKKEAIAVLRELLEIGKVTPIIDSTYHLSEVREALRHMIEDEIQGKVIITPATPMRCNSDNAGLRKRSIPAHTEGLPIQPSDADGAG